VGGDLITFRERNGNGLLTSREGSIQPARRYSVQVAYYREDVRVTQETMLALQRFSFL
jgi:hypothetical protein